MARAYGVGGRIAAWALLVLVGSGVHAGEAPPGAARHERGAHDATARHSFEDVAHWVSVFDDPSRDAWQKPREVVAALGIEPGMWVADLGAGTGYFSGHLARAAQTGAVLALEPEPNLLVHLRSRAEKEGMANLVPVLASPDNPRLPPRSVDLVLIVNTVHHIDDRVSYLRALERSLRPGGRVAIIDFKKEEVPVGPPLEHKLARQQVVEEMELAGYELVAEPGFLPYQYFLVFSPDRGRRVPE